MSLTQAMLRPSLAGAMSITITIMGEDDEFEDIIKICKHDFDTETEYLDFLRQVYKFEFDRFLIDGDIVLEGESYNEGLDLYIDLDNASIDEAMDKVNEFNKFIDLNNRF